MTTLLSPRRFRFTITPRSGRAGGGKPTGRSRKLRIETLEDRAVPAVTLIRSDLEFILQQTQIAEQHAAGANIATLIPNNELAFGLRTVDGSFNNLVAGQTQFGTADNVFPRLLDPAFRNDLDGDTFDANGPAPGGLITNTNFAVSGHVVDADPRLISNLVVDQTAANPAAQAAADQTPGSEVVSGTRTNGTTFDTFFIPNVAPDAGLSAPFNAWMTFFGQFFDHGLDLVNKGGNGNVFIPLQPGDPLFVPGSPANFMVITRATNRPGPDGVLGTADDVHEHTNQTSPFVDQNQTYTSHPSHQVFLRAYELDPAGRPVSTGKLLVNRDLGPDGRFGTADDVPIGGMATWAVVKAQARDLLGIRLTDADVNNVPLLATDPYGRFIPGPNGFPRMVTTTGVLVAGNPNANGGTGVPVPANVVRTGHAFLDDIAHTAAPGPLTAPLAADPDTAVGNQPAAGQYDNELLDRHYVAGDGRVNENIGLTTVHHVFHAEHNRLVGHVQDVLLATAAGGDVAFLNQWLLAPVTAVPADPAALRWNGERLFQAAKFGTEMQYQHLVFEEFARTIQPLVDAFIDFNVALNPAIVAEFAHTVYRFGHSMLTETVDRLDPAFASSEMGLIQAFLNPLAFAASGPTPEAAAGAIVRGLTRQVGNEIDEFVTEALRNNLLGLPLDLPAINMSRARDTGIPGLNAARREFHAQTGDSQLAAYTSWADFAGHLKHPESLVNFVAAYGTHPTVTAAATAAGKRAAAGLLVLGGAGEPADRLAFLNSTGAWASTPAGVTTTGLDDVDFWVGGLAEEKMPFGGMLGATFNFVFETQLEALQNGDRLYYLHRLPGTNFFTELENNSFSKVIMANTDATHLPGLVFSTPGLILEVDPSKQFNAAVEPDPRQDPVGDDALLPLVNRDNPATAGPDANYLEYTGADHVVLGGTDPGNAANPSGRDILIGSEGDDTYWGDGGNDRIEGGFGNDDINGGPGDDIITDVGGDDVIHADEGNDVVQAGNGINLIIAGPGSDFIVTGEDFSEVFAGPGNDFILGSPLNVEMLGNEGDDWIEIGTQEGAPGDNFDPFELDTVAGNDVFVGTGQFDEMLGEGGDDIMVGSDGPDKMEGASGFDWATFKNEAAGVNADFFRNLFFEAPLPATQLGAGSRFFQVEGLSGSPFGDVLRGDNADALQIAAAGARGSVLRNFDLIAGLRAFVGSAGAGPDGVTGTADDQFGAGNVILGGGGSDILEGRGGDDLIDGDRWLNVRISVRQNANGTGPEIRSVNSLTELVEDMVAGRINPGQLRVVRQIMTASGFDTAVYSGPVGNYTITVDQNGTPGNPNDDVVTVTDNVGTEGTDRLTRIERLIFNGGQANQTVVLVAGLNAEPDGRPRIRDVATNTLLTTPPAAGQVLRAAIGNVTDADGPITGPVSFTWQFEPVPGTGVFQDISDLLAPQGAASAVRQEYTVGADLVGSALRVKVQYLDAHGVMEIVFSQRTDPVVAGAPAPVLPPLMTAEQPGMVSAGIHLLGSDLQFILDQIITAERHAAGENLADILPNLRVAEGLRTVDGSFNNLLTGQSGFGAADNVFPRLLDPAFRNDLDGDTFDANGPAPGGLITNTNFAVSGHVVDADPRLISNLVVDQTAANPAAQAAADQTPGSEVVSGTRTNGTTFDTFFIPNVAPDAGLSAPFNAWMTFFGQFFDHGLDLVNKGGNGNVFIPLQPGDPLFVPGSPANFMVITRATNRPGPDGVLGTADDVHEHTNQTSPFVDQNQTYTSHPSHQVFLRAYELDPAGRPVSTGNLLVNRDLGPDGRFGTADDVPIGGMATWAVVKAQARDLLGIRLTDADVNNVPLLATDPYGRFIPGPVRGMPQIVRANGNLAEGNPAANGGNGINIDGPNAVGVRTGHAFMDDIAHMAAPGPLTAPLAPDPDTAVGNQPAAGQYDNELLDRHYVAGDGRVNENIGLTTVHHVFHAEHNRLVGHVKDVLLATAAGGDVTFLNKWLLAPVTAVPADPAALRWNGERLFQAAKFGTEMQYQHLVFEEFARTIQPNIDPFLIRFEGYDININPAIVAEFAHTVYRFGHSMLTETVDRLDPAFASSEMGLIQAFLNPLAFAASGPTPEAAAGAIVRGLTRQVGNEIDEFVTEALRNNLLGLPLDLPAINMSRARDTGIPGLNAARREFHAQTGDSQLAAYTSWADFAGHLKHPESLVNFVAAYGTHPTVTAAATAAGKRAAAGLLVLGGAGEPADRLDFLNSTGAWASTPAGVTTTGLDDVDFWVGGLAEEKMPFGGMLGATFNFVFETQLEALQNGDRLYYLARTDGLNFFTELENNSFSKLIMANTDTTHLPASVFTTPGWFLEVDPSKQFNRAMIAGPDGIEGTADDLPGNTDPEDVSRDNPATAGPDANYLEYAGDQHVVLGGTNPGSAANPSGRDILVGSEGDDALYGDGGNDRMDGGFGNDVARGGTGDDIITDSGGDDVLHGDDGNDVIHGGNGINLILGGFGSDFIVTGEDESEAFGGPGNDFILGSDGVEQDMGNEGDDWLEGGLLDGSPGDNFAPFGDDRIIGNDVYVGSNGPDRMIAEGGDDIMVGSVGPADRFLGASGFDWATFKDDVSGVDIDLRLRVLDAAPVPAVAGILARFREVEGLSGSQFNDFLRGDDADALSIPSAGRQGSVLRNIGLINNLQSFLGAGVTSFGAGNILLGGGGSDIIEGFGGDDLIDGDRWLNVRISVRANPDGTGPEVASFDSMVDMVPHMLAGTYSPGQLRVVREVLPGSAGFDTAVFSDVRANYVVTTTGGVTTVQHVVGGLPGPDGTDRLTNIERLQFNDQAVVLTPGLNNEPVGQLAISDATPSAFQLLTVSAAGITDANNPGGTIGEPISYFWQAETAPGSGLYQDIQVLVAGGVTRAMGPTFRVTPDLLGSRLRVRGVYQDAHGVLENVFSAPTAVVAPDVTRPNVTINQAPAQNDPTISPAILFQVVFNEPVTGFDGSDIILAGTAGATTAAVSTADNITFTVAVRGMTADGTVIARVPANVAQDAGGNNNLAFTTTDNTVRYDTTRPTVTINQAPGQADPTNASSNLFRVVFSEPVTGFDGTDVVLGGTAGATTATVTPVSTTVYNVDVTGMTTSGTVIATVPSSGARDAAGNANVASTSTDNTVTFDSVRPTVTINQAADQPDPAGSGPIRFTVVFSKPVTGFTGADVTIGGTAGAVNANVSGSGTTYTVSIGGMTGSGTVTASIPAGAAQDVAGNTNVASTSTDNTVTFDNVRPAVTIDQAVGQADPTSGASIAFTAVFSEPVTGFDAADVMVAGNAPGTKVVTVSGSGTTYNVVVSGMTGTGTVIARVPGGGAQDAAGNNNLGFTATDNTVTYAGSLVASWGFEEGSGPTTANQIGSGLTGTLTNAAWTPAGRFGNALSFNGTNALVTVADDNRLDLVNGMTIEAWVQPTGTDASQPGWTTVVLKEQGTNGLAYALYGSDNTAQPPAGYVDIAGTDRSAVGTSVLPLDTWTHLAVTFDGARLRLYVNGVLVRNLANAGSISTSAEPLRFGGNTVFPGGEFFRGLIDEIRIYNRALSAAEIGVDMTTPIGGGGGAQLADRPAADPAADPAAKPVDLTADRVGPVVTAAVDLWRAAGLPVALLPAAESVRVTLADLPGNSLGFTDMRTGQIWLDRDAAGYGWDPAAGGYDLPTVMAHEIGHLFGIEDLPADPTRPADLMDQVLLAGEVRQPSEMDVRLATAPSGAAAAEATPMMPATGSAEKPAAAGPNPVTPDNVAALLPGMSVWDLPADVNGRQGWYEVRPARLDDPAGDTDALLAGYYSRLVGLDSWDTVGPVDGLVAAQRPNDQDWLTALLADPIAKDGLE